MTTTDIAGPAAASTEVARTATSFKILLLASLGGALEFYDFIIFVFLTSSIQTLFFSASTSPWLRTANTFGIFAAGYLTRPVGGIVMAHFGDTRGRKRVFTLSILMMAVPTLAIGLLPTYARIGVAAPLLLLLLRMMQGAAIGGEAPGGWVYVAEHVPPRRVGLAVGLLTGGLCLGILLGSAVSLTMTTLFDKTAVLAGVWRVPFLIGGFFGLIGMWLRNQLAETPVFIEMRQRAARSRSAPLMDLLNEHRWAVVQSFGVTWMLTAAIVVVILMTPILLGKLYAIPARPLQVAGLAASAALCVSAVLVGWAADRFKPAVVAAVAVTILVAATYLLYAEAGPSQSHLVFISALAGAGAGSVVLAPLCMVRAFPAAVRFTGVSFSYNIAYAILGGATPPLVLLLTSHDRLGPAHYVAAASVAGLVSLLWPVVKSGTAKTGQPVTRPI